jgi:branched-chain amino acid transport system ATP-binding protein
MNSAEKHNLMNEIVKLDDGALSILIIEHDMRFVMEICQRIAVLNFGRLIAQGNPTEIRANAEVIEAYLGQDDDATDGRSGAAS